MNEDNLKHQIAYVKARLSLVTGLMVVFVMMIGLMVWREYSQEEKRVTNMKKEFVIEREKFKKLWSELIEKTNPVELEQEIRYGEDIGKLEPFE